MPEDNSLNPYSKSYSKDVQAYVHPADTPTSTVKVEAGESRGGQIPSFSKHIAASFDRTIRAFYEAASQVINSIFKRGISVPPQMDKNLRITNLTGKTIDPSIAGRYLKKINFDHTGKFLSVKSDLSLKELRQIELAVQALSLTQTNSKSERTAPRTDREILLDLTNLLNKNKRDGNVALNQLLDASIDQIKQQWLNAPATSSDPNFSKTIVLLNQIEERFKGIHPEIAQYAHALSSEAAKPKAFTQQYDNTFGRKFESELVFSLVKNCPESIKSAAKVGGEWLFNECEKLPPESKEKFLKNLSNAMAYDPRPWHVETPSVAQFLANPNMDNLEQMLKPANLTGFDVAKFSWVGVKAANSFPDPKPDFKVLCDDNYGKIVAPSRSSKASLSMGVKLETQPINVIAKQVNTLFDKRSKQPGYASSAKLQQSYVRANLDAVGFSANTPAALASHLFSMVNDLRAKGDFELANLLLMHANWAESLPDQNAEFQIVEAKIDDIDNQRMASNKQYLKPTVQTSGYGTTLAHQRMNVGGANWRSGMAVTGKSTIDFEHLKGFDQSTLSHEMNSVCGPSGSTNIMTFMYLQMQKDNPSLNLEDAFAGTMMFLTLDGGHSLPESVGTFRSITADTRPMIQNGKPSPEAAEIAKKRKAILEGSVLEYGQLSKSFSNPETAGAIDLAVESAWKATTHAFKEIHEERISS